MATLGKLRKRWLTNEERQLLKAIEQERPKEKPKSKTAVISERRASLSTRIRKAIRDRRIPDYGDVLLLDGKPLRECTPEVRKAFLIQCQIKSFYIWDADDDTILSEDGLVYDLIDKEHVCPKCFRFIEDAKICKFCGEVIKKEA